MKDQSSPGFFPDTRWSLIQHARSDGDAAGKALEEWSQNYREPIYTYILSRVRDPGEAEELTQEFFFKFLRKGVGKMLPEQLEGAFRAHLMRSIRNFLTDEWRHSQSQKAGGGVEHVSADALGDVEVEEESRQMFDRSWALNLMELALARLQREMKEKGKQETFEALAPFLGGRKMSEEDRRDLASRLDLQEAHLRVSLHRLRVRYRSAIESEIRDTVSSEEEFLAEKRYMLSLWS